MTNNTQDEAVKYIGVKHPSKYSKGNLGDVWYKDGDIYRSQAKKITMTEEQIQSDIKNGFLKPMANNSQDEALYQEILKAINVIPYFPYSEFANAEDKLRINLAKAITDICNKEKIRFAKEFAEWLDYGYTRVDMFRRNNFWQKRTDIFSDSIVTTEELIEQFSSTTNKGIQ